VDRYIQRSALVPEHVLNEAPFNRLGTWAKKQVFGDPRTDARGTAQKPAGMLGRFGKWIAPDTYASAEEKHLGQIAANWLWEQLAATVRRKDKEEDGIDPKLLHSMILGLKIQPNKTYSQAQDDGGVLPTLDWLSKHTNKLKEPDIIPLLQNLGHESVRWGKGEYGTTGGVDAMTDAAQFVNILKSAGLDDFTHARVLRLAISHSTGSTNIPNEDTTL
jgi:hypothetical protein